MEFTYYSAWPGTWMRLEGGVRVMEESWGL